MKIGEKIRAERKKANLTQKELAGDEITRNMLSRIESGDALPSLSTLFYLAKRLSLPAAYFVSEDETPFLYHKQKVLPFIWEAIQSSRMEDALSLCLSVEMDDELSYLAALCAVHCGERALKNGNLKSAKEFFEQAEVLSFQTKIPTEHLKALILLYGAIAQNIASPQLVFNKNAYLESANNVVDSDLYHFISEDMEYTYMHPLYAKHMTAKRHMQTRNWKDALMIFKELEDLKGTPQINAFMLFRLYADMEICYRELQDYENAYRYSNKRMHQISAFQN